MLILKRLGLVLSIRNILYGLMLQLKSTMKIEEIDDHSVIKDLKRGMEATNGAVF